MKPKNFPGRKNDRRIKAFNDLSKKKETFEAEIRKKQEEVKSFEKQLEGTKLRGDVKLLSDKIENHRRSIKNIEAEIKYMDKELNSLKKVITTEEVAKNTRTKKYRGAARL